MPPADKYKLYKFTNSTVKSENRVTLPGINIDRRIKFDYQVSQYKSQQKKMHALCRIF